MRLIFIPNQTGFSAKIDVCVLNNQSILSSNQLIALELYTIDYEELHSSRTRIDFSKSCVRKQD